jgi:hypothetical protein
VNAILETVFTPSVTTAAHDDEPKQSSARTPCPDFSEDNALIDWDEAL